MFMARKSTLESTKSVSDLYAPVSGTVLARNDSVETAPESINADPYGAGWLADVTVTDSSHISVIVPAHVVGTVDVKVRNWDTQEGTKANAFTYVHGAAHHMVGI